MKRSTQDMTRSNVVFFLRTNLVRIASEVRKSCWADTTILLSYPSLLRLEDRLQVRRTGKQFASSQSFGETFYKYLQRNEDCAM